MVRVRVDPGFSEISHKRLNFREEIFFGSWERQLLINMEAGGCASLCFLSYCNHVCLPLSLSSGYSLILTLINLLLVY